MAGRPGRQVTGAFPATPSLGLSEVAHLKRPPRACLAGESDSPLERPLQNSSHDPRELVSRVKQILTATRQNLIHQPHKVAGV